MFNNQTVLITGGTGSFGRNFASHLLANYQLKKLIILSRDEWKQFQMQAKLKDERLRFFLGDIRDLSRLERAFHGVDIIIHAAALKQIPILEYNPFEGVKTNILGTQNVIEAAINQGVKKVLLISTDKAAQPINLYGSTKLCAEKLFINGNSYSGDKTIFSCVRYGNVLGSRGSIVEMLLRDKNIKEVGLTHECMTRFWITLRQSFELVTYALGNMRGGEIFIPKAPSMKLIDLFDALVPAAAKKIIGIRPGEKLHEILITVDEARHALELEKFYVILPEHYEIFDIKKRYADFFAAGHQLSENFSFASDNNKQWLTTAKLKKLLNISDHNS